MRAPPAGRRPRSRPGRARSAALRREPREVAAAGDALTPASGSGAVRSAQRTPSQSAPARTATTSAAAAARPAAARAVARSHSRTAAQRTSRLPAGGTTVGAGRGRRPGTWWVSSVRGPRPVRPSSTSGTPATGRRTGSGRQACRRSSANAAAEPRCADRARDRGAMTSSSSAGASGASSARSGSRPVGGDVQGVPGCGGVPGRDAGERVEGGGRHAEDVRRRARRPAPGHGGVDVGRRDLARPPSRRAPGRRRGRSAPGAPRR